MDGEVRATPFPFGKATLGSQRKPPLRQPDAPASSSSPDRRQSPQEGRYRQH